MANLLDQNSSVPLLIGKLVLTAPGSVLHATFDPRREARVTAAHKRNRSSATRGLSPNQPPSTSFVQRPTLRKPSDFPEFGRLVWDSLLSTHQAPEEQLGATRVLQVAAVVANCNTYNRNQPVGELRKGRFFRGRAHEAGIESSTESFRTAFQTIHDLIGRRVSDNCRMFTSRPSDYPSHAPSVQC